MEKKQTALDYFVKKLEVMRVNNLSEFYNEIEIAKQMEKEQIGDAYKRGFISDDIKLADDYYNEAFGGETE